MPLRSPELYNLAMDPDESYDVAAEHPDVVKEIQGRIEKLIGGFPENIQKAWADNKAKNTAPTPAGQYPRAVK
jgi:arylsulfatase